MGGTAGRTGRVLKGSVLNTHPFDNIPEAAWEDLTDPVSFVVGSLLILFYSPRVASSESQPLDGFAAGGRFGAALGVMLWVAMPVLIGLLFPHIGTGDPFWYATTLLVAGAVTFVPGRIAELRGKQRLRGTGYPRTLRKALWWVEVGIEVAGVVTIFVWKFGGPENHPVLRAIVWGLLAVSASEFSTLGAARGTAIAESRAAPPEPKPPQAGAEGGATRGGEPGAESKDSNTRA